MVKTDKTRHVSPVKMSEVARLADVSLMTVSRALNSPEKLSPETLRKVLDVVAETGYVPNLTAGSLRSAKTRLIAVFTPYFSGHFAEMIQTVSEALTSKSYQVILGQTEYSTLREADLVQAIIGRRPDGIIVTGVEHSPETRSLLIQSRIPVVETWDLTPTPIDMLVGFSHEEISSAVCNFLVARGRKNIALISNNDPRALRRNEAFLATARKIGLETPVVKSMPFPLTHGKARTAFAELLAEYSKMDAVYCSSDVGAMGVLTEAQVRGIAIPGDLAVVGTGDFDFAATLHPSLTTVRLGGAIVGAKAAQFILDRVEGREVVNKIVKVGISIIERQSS